MYFVCICIDNYGVVFYIFTLYVVLTVFMYFETAEMMFTPACVIIDLT